MSLSRMFFLTNCVYWLDYSPFGIGPIPNALNTNNNKKNSIQIPIQLVPKTISTFANRFFFFCNIIPATNKGIPTITVIAGK